MIAHGVTDLKFHGDIGDPEERKLFKRKYKEVIKGHGATRKLGEDYIVYGSAFARIYFPFNRQLRDSRSGFLKWHSLAAFPEALTKFNLQKLTYSVPDPERTDLPMDRRPTVDLTFRDVKRKTAKGIRIIRLNPRFVKLRYSTWADDRQVEYSFEPEFLSRIRKGELFEVNRTPMEIIRCVRDKREFLFKQDQVFCMINETISGFVNSGFGLPEPISAFPQLYRMATYDRLNESISNEMMQPYRFISPTPNTDGGTLDGGEFRYMVQRAVSEQRMDRSLITAVPTAINYQEVGGNGKSLVPKELKDYETTQLMHALGIPSEMMTGSLRMDNIPYAIRLFESSHADLFEDLSNFTNWCVERITRFLYREAFDATLEASSVVDDANRRVMLRDLYGAQEIPRRVLGESLQLDDMIGLKKERAQEDLKTQEDLAGLEEEARRRAEAGSIEELMNQGPSPGPGGAPVTTPVDTMDEATAVAQEWLGMDESQRSQAMRALAATNRQLYAMAKDIKAPMLAEGASQGAQMVYQQAQQGPNGP